ncbi:MAG: ATP-binding cassette domain-containing protein, partial [Sphingopyxis sp.]|nr:ATP-binding cassette domain-containing protein [Sphingopyxis sp.]
MLNVSNLSVSLAGKRVLEDVSFSANPGTVTIVIGPNGSGKSTLVKAICGS